MTSKIRTIRPLQLKFPYKKRLYHSYDHPPPPGPFNAVETSILSACIPYIPSNGFTHTTLSLGAKDTGYIDASTNLFPSGSFSLVHYHLYTQRLRLAQHKHILEQSTPEEEPLGVGAKVKALTWERLMGNKEIVHRWQEVRIDLLVIDAME
jgi:ubiquinone biosynthesis protein COQ9